jgi:hypothetical protein
MIVTLLFKDEEPPLYFYAKKIIWAFALHVVKVNNQILRTSFPKD